MYIREKNSNEWHNYSDSDTNTGHGNLPCNRLVVKTLTASLKMCNISHKPWREFESQAKSSHQKMWKLGGSSRRFYSLGGGGGKTEWEKPHN